jgi:ectoine hydrolase
MRRAAKIVERMHATIVEMAEVGLPKNRLVAELYKVSVEGADGHWGDYPAIVPMLPSGMDATAPHLTWDDQPFVKARARSSRSPAATGATTARNRARCSWERCRRKYLDAEKAVLEAVDAGLEKAKPGNTCEDIAIAFYDTLERHGFSKDSRTGYSIGLSYPPDWGERTMSFRRGDKTVLEPGMIFHFMPALWLDDGGLEITEPILITETGVETLCNTPTQTQRQGIDNWPNVPARR